MKQFITNAAIALLVFCGVMFITQTCSATPSRKAPNAKHYNNYNYGMYNYGMEMPVNPAIGTRAPQHSLTPTQMRTGYTRDQIRSMPMVSRPNRPGHFIGNTVRRRNSH